MSPQRIQQLLGFIWVFSMIISLSACSEETNDNKLAVKESYGMWKSGDNSIGWIPTKVNGENKYNNRALQGEIIQILEAPTLSLLHSHDLFNRPLLNKPPEEQPWSSGFFPSWFNGVAGRWQHNGLRELFGFNLYTTSSALFHLYMGATSTRTVYQKLYYLSPIEKYDLSVGNYKWKATRRERELRGNDKDGFNAFWAGYCNGISAAAIQLKEPFRRVTVINGDGYKIHFHPYDIKALLALAYYKVEYDDYARLGSRCKSNVYNTTSSTMNTVGNYDDEEPISYKRVDDPKCRGLNPATFVIALQTRLGIAKESFVVDKIQDKKVSNHPIGEAQIDILRSPYAFTFKEYGMHASPGTVRLLDVKISVFLSSTALSDDDAVNRPIDFKKGIYKKIGFIPEETDSPKVYYATLELDKWDQIIGGEWGIKDKYGSYTKSNAAPDFAWFGVKPLLVDENKMKDTYNLRGDALEEAIAYNESIRCQNEEGETCDSLLSNPVVKWPILEAIYQKSILTSEDSPNPPVLYLKDLALNLPARKQISWSSNDPGSSLKSTLHLAHIGSKAEMYEMSGFDRKDYDFVAAGYIKGSGQGAHPDGTLGNFRVDIVRMYGSKSDQDIGSHNFEQMKSELKFLGSHTLYKRQKNPENGRYFFRVKTSKFRPKYKKIILVAERWKRKGSRSDLFAKDRNNRKIVSQMGVFQMWSPHTEYITASPR